MKQFCCVIILLVLSGCTFVSRNLYEAEGDTFVFDMSKDEVTAKMGDPSEIKTLTIDGEACEVWRYPIERKFARHFNALDASYYEIVFVEGKVSRWERVKKYTHPDYDFVPLAPEGNVKTYDFFKAKEK